MILDPAAVANIRFRFGGHCQIAALCASHEKLRTMFEESAERVAKQSDLLSQRAERMEVSHDGNGR